MNSPIRVLLVEDDEDDFILTRDLLDEVGDMPFELQWESDFDRARAVLGRGEHDVCLLDYRLGERDGLELLHEARAEGWDVPVVVLTGRGDRDLDLQFMRAGASYYLAKTGLDASALDRALRYVLELRRAERRAQESEACVQAVIAHAFDGIITMDQRGIVQSFNPAAERMFGYAADEVVGRNVNLLMPEPDRSRHDEYVTRYLRSGEARVIGRHREVRGLHKDGHLVPIDLAISEMRVGSERLFIGTLRDISERLAAAEALQRLNAELEARVAERTAALEVANADLETFSYSVSHDLRAPLRAISGFAQALREDCWDVLPEAARDYLTRVLAAAERMSNLIDDLLRLARVARAELNREPVDLSALAGEIVEELRRAAPQRQVTVTIAPGLIARGDRTLLRSVLENLLANAWKYTSRHPQAQITVDAEPHADGQAFFVRDDGAGFDPAYAERLFGAFQRLHNPNEFEGTGVGLATVQRIIHRHGGRVWAHGAVEQGATFYFTLPE